MDLGGVFRSTAERYPQRIAVGGDDPLSYAEWDARTEATADALIDLGALPGARAAFVLGGGEPLATLHWAAQKAGVASVPLSIRLAPEELAYCLADSRPALTFADATTWPVLEQALPSLEHVPTVVWVGEAVDRPAGCRSLAEAVRAASTRVLPAVDPLAISVMLYTSGTTGRPKGVPRTHRAEHYSALAHLIQTGHSPGDRTLGVMPLFHTMGLRSLLATVVAAGTWVPQASFDAQESMRLICEHAVTALYLVPTIYWSLLETGRLAEATSVRRLAYAGAAMTPALTERLAQTLSPERLINHFGSTEIYTFSIGPDGFTKPGCAGRAGIFSDLRLVVPEHGASPDDTVAAGEQGQVAVSLKSPEAFTGYWNRPDADEKVIRDGWYFPGDLATTDSDGDLWVSGRIDDMINSGGENIYPDEIERTLTRCTGVAEIVVAGLPHDKWGQAVTAFVVPAAGQIPSEAIDKVVEFARDESRLASLKRPKRYVALDQIPKSAVGKVLRRRLAAGEYEAIEEREL